MTRGRRTVTGNSGQQRLDRIPPAPLDPDAPDKITLGEVQLFGRGLREGWKIPQTARVAGIKMLREAIATGDPRVKMQATRILAAIDQKELDLQLKAQSLGLKRELLDIKREQLGLERAQFQRQDDPDIRLTVQFVDELPDAPVESNEPEQVLETPAGSAPQTE